MFNPEMHIAFKAIIVILELAVVAVVLDQIVEMSKKMFGKKPR